MQRILNIIIIIISAALMAAILLQRRGAGNSAIFGSGGSGYYTKRGFEKILFIATIILGALFIFANFANLLF